MRIRQHVNPLRLQFQTPRARQLDLPLDREVEVELGCAEGQFLFERARQDPRRVELGLEIREELVHQVNRQARALGLDVTAIFTNINVELATLFAPGVVARMFINFPDPWFKARHRNRRLMDPGVVTACHRALRPAGELWFQSDVFDLSLDAMEIFENDSTLFANEVGAWSFWREESPWGVRSRREDQCRLDGAPIWRMLYRKSI